jgi:hypothetical protein
MQLSAVTELVSILQFAHRIQANQDPAASEHENQANGNKRKLGALKVPEPEPLAYMRAESPTSSVSTINSKQSNATGSTAATAAITGRPEVGRKKVTKKKIVTEQERAGIPDHDIRTKFPDIFCTAFNNYDREKYAHIIKNYCEEELLVIYDYVGFNPYNWPKYLEVRGRDTVVVFWDTLLTSYPDSIFQIHATKYKVLPNDFTAVVCSFSFKGTKIYNMTGVDNNFDESVVVSFEKLAVSGAPKLGGFAQAGKIMASLAANAGENSPVNPQSSRPLELETNNLRSMFVTVFGTLTFYVNPNKKIYRMSFVHSMKPEGTQLAGI